MLVADELTPNDIPSIPARKVLVPVSGAIPDAVTVQL